MNTAIKNFQRFAGLKVTGRLDRATVTLMKKPRCGMPDDVAARSRVRRYKTGSKWRKTHLTYFIQHGRDLPHSQQDRIFQRALQYWADVSGLSFSRSSSSNADLKIRWEDVKEKMTILASATTILGISHDLSPWTLGGGCLMIKRALRGTIENWPPIYCKGGRGRGEDHKNDTGPYGGIR